MAELILGPMLRYVGHTCATIWVETDLACDVEVLGHRARTFCVEGHHYALVIVEDLAPASTTAYEVALDGRTCWPPAGSPFPPSVIRTIDEHASLRVLFGSCRAAAPHEPPWSLELAADDRGRGVDALRAHGLRMLREPSSTWPDLVLLLGDQVYADDSSPEARQRIRDRRADDPDIPIESVADFEEYTWLYHEAWRPEVERWLFSVVPSAMVFDDHDMIDDWNISASWVADIRAQTWWREHVVGGLVSYWIYQHLGNLSPEDIRAEGMLEAVGATEDAGAYLRRWAEASESATPVPGGYRFSFHRDLGRVRVVVIDCRNGRVLTPAARAMVDDAEWAWVVEQASVECDHLLLVTSLPVLLPVGIHDLQVWNDRVCAGAWSRVAIGFGERIRRAIDLEDWPAFGGSFARFVELLGAAATPDPSHVDREPPATISVLSGDVHFSYVADVHLPGAGPVSRVHQLVSSPIRNALVPKERRAIRFSLSRAGQVVGRLLRWSVRGARPTASWTITDGPLFANVMSQVTFDGRAAHLRIEQARPDDEGQAILEVVVETAL